MKRFLVLILLIVGIASVLNANIERSKYCVFITDKGKKYHIEDCRTIKNSINKTPISVCNAINSGYMYCKVCLSSGAYLYEVYSSMYLLSYSEDTCITF